MYVTIHVIIYIKNKQNRLSSILVSLSHNPSLNLSPSWGKEAINFIKTFAFFVVVSPTIKLQLLSNIGS